MRIETKKKLRYVIMADYMMNRGYYMPCVKDRVINLFIPDYTMQYLKSMRYKEYYRQKKGLFSKIGYIIYSIRNKRIGVKLGYSISSSVFGYGLVIPHYGTIVVGGGNTIGNYAVLHTSTCITNGNKVIGDAFYLSTGSIVLNNITIGDNVSVGANSLVNTSFVESDIMIAGSPAKAIKKTKPWFERDGITFLERYKNCERLMEQLL